MSHPVNPPPTSPAELDTALARVRGQAGAWARLPVGEKADLVRALREGFHASAEAAVRLACQVKGLAFDAPASGQEWFHGPMTTLRALRLLEPALREVAQHGAPVLQPKQLSALPDGRLCVRTFPHDVFDTTLFANLMGEVQLEAGVTRENLAEHQASFYRHPHDGRVCALLGVGGVEEPHPTDVLSRLFVDGMVCVLALGPLTGWLGPVLERAFAPLISRGFLALVHVGAEQQGALARHPAVDAVHLTGSATGFEELATLLDKPFTARLGNVTPVVVLPGRWDDGCLDYQARNTAGMVSQQGGLGATGARLLVTAREWPQRRDFLTRVERYLRQAGPPAAWAPGVADRWHRRVDGRDQVRLIGRSGAGELAWAVVTGVDPADGRDPAFREDPWAPVLTEVALPADDTPGFCAAAARFLNEQVWGTLAAHVLVHPDTRRLHAEAVEGLVRELRYGVVVVNTWAGAVVSLGMTPWGAAPGATRGNPQSGRGWVNNPWMLDGVEKCVLRGPATSYPMPPWFPGHHTAHFLGRKHTDFEYAPTLLKVPGIASAAMRG